MEVGYYLSESEVNELVNSFANMKKFQNLLTEMKKHRDFDINLEDLKVNLGLKYDVRLKKEEHVISAKFIELQINEDVTISYTTRFRDGDTSTTNDFFVGRIISNKKDEPNTFEQLVFRSRNDDEAVNILESEFTQDLLVDTMQKNEKFFDKFNLDENYVPGQLLEEVNAEGIWTGCLTGGYIWCGEDCGGHPACVNGRNGINEVDNCCRSHDCCYHAVSDHKWCDNQLCQCVSYYPQYYASTLIVTYFCLF